MSFAYWLNSAWMWSCRREAKAFGRATHAVARTQEAVLREMLTANRDTTFGRRHGFSSVDSPRDYQRRVPLSTFDTYASYVQEIAAGKNKVLTADRVELLEPTSGTTAGEKLIPYTSTLRAQFQQAVAAWVADVMHHRPRVRRGRAYWSISPLLGPPRQTAGGVRIGFDSDAAYLSRWQQRLVRHLMIMPPAVTALPAVEDFRYFTLLHLVAAADLALISVWNPTFLTALFSPLGGWIDRICDDLRDGRLRLSATPSVRRRRSEELRAIFRHGGSLPEKLRQVWPSLDLISCWADAAASTQLPALQALFPEVDIQPKGLISTEACVSFPLCGRPGAALAVRSHFFEFREWPGNNSAPSGIRLAHELEAGGRYEVIVTTGGGLYRYQSGDVIEVTGFENQCPLVRLVGRADRVCDLVGEKLGEPHVQEVLHRVFAAHRLAPGFAMVVPAGGDLPGYRLYIQGDGERLAGRLDALNRDAEAGLRSNPHYDLAVRLGQLRPLEVTILDVDLEEVCRVYERAWLTRGKKLGEIKPCVLDSWPGWRRELDGCRRSEAAPCA